MRNRFIFYLFIAALIVLDSVLLRSPNLLGKIGLVIYKYHYLRTFPKTLLTVSMVVGAAVLISESIRWLTTKGTLRRTVSIILLLLLLLGSVAILVKTGLDFSTWTYSHTGSRFKYGAYLLPLILGVVFLYHFIILPHQPTEPLDPTAATGEKS